MGHGLLRRKIQAPPDGPRSGEVGDEGEYLHLGAGGELRMVPTSWSILGPLNRNSPPLSASSTTIAAAGEAPSLRCQLLPAVVTRRFKEVLKTGVGSRRP